VKIGRGKFVKVDYNVQTTDGEQVDSSDDRGPLEFVYGEGKVLKSLEQELKGLSVGDEKTITLKPKQAYGEYDNDAVTKIPRDKFPEDEKINEVTIDFNHPLAGKTLKFNVFVQEVREAQEADYSGKE